MATYYVRPDGNDANTGLGSTVSSAWRTVQKALGATGITGGDTLWIAPGTYRESVTIGGAYASATNVYGNPTASQFVGVSAGEVRITPVINDNTVSTSYSITATSKNNFTFRDLVIGGMTLTNCTNTVVERCLFHSTSDTTEAFYFNATTTANFNTTIRQSIFIGTTYGLRYGFVNNSTQYTTGLSVSNCYLSGNSAVWLNGAANFAAFPAGGMNFYNCVLVGAVPFYANSGGITGTSTGNNITIYNSLIYATGSYAFQQANASYGIIENYNRVYGVNNRANISQGSNTTVASWHGLDFGQSLLQGYGPVQIFGNTFNSPNALAGLITGAPTVDMYSQAWGVNPDIGVAKYRTLTGIGTYLPNLDETSQISITAGSTSRSLYLYLGATGLTATTTGLQAYYTKEDAAPVSIPLVAQTTTGAWVSGGFAEVSAINQPGIYRLDIPDAAISAGYNQTVVTVRGASGTNGAVVTIQDPPERGSHIYMGPYKLISNHMGADNPLEVLKGVQAPVVIQLVDNSGGGIDITGATVTAKVYNASSQLIDTYTCTPTYALDGRCSFNLDTTVTDNSGHYTVTVTRQVGGNIVVFGPLRCLVRAN